MNFIGRLFGKKKSEQPEETVIAKGVAHISWIGYSILNNSTYRDGGYVSVDIIRESETKYYVKFTDKELENAWISKSCIELEANDV